MNFSKAFLAILLSCFISTPVWAGKCQQAPLPKINIVMTSKQVQYDFSRSKRELKGFNIDTKSPYDSNAHTEVGGLMNGEISVNSQVSFGYLQDTNSGQAWYWYDTIDVKMHIDPTILIAKEHAKGTCEHSAILEHEMKHIKIDRAVLKKYKAKIESDLHKIARKVGTIGPISLSISGRTQNKMMKVIEKAVSNQTERMYSERRKLQQSVDSLEEYERVSNMCK